MLGYIARRIMVMIPTLIAISAISFVIIQLPPGDYLTTLVTEAQSRGSEGGVDL
ncbi:MAG TPA: ABC transporter permease, partial [Alphaproteobacteria bacterium]|nr:ABC transporter permease [Alphaproteobacteria bacterium]